MKKILVVTVGLACALAATFAAAQVTLYQSERFYGRTFTTNGPVPNLDRLGFNDRASSVIVDRGEWQVCEDSDFRGRCIVLRPGQYPSLGAMGLNNRVSSLRRVSGGPKYAYAPAPPPAPYPYYPHYGERLYPADVVATRAVVGPPEQRCWVERQQVAAPAQPNVPGAIIGGVLGGVLGHQIGSGTRQGRRDRRRRGVGCGDRRQRQSRQPGLHAGRAALRRRSRHRPGRVLGRDLRVPGRHASRAAWLRAGRHDQRQRPWRAARVRPLMRSFDRM